MYVSCTNLRRFVIELRSNHIAAIDPGNKGAVALWNGSNVYIFNLSSSASDNVELLLRLAPSKVYLEDVGQHIKGDSATSSAILAKHTGVLEGCLRAMGTDVIMVKPRKWMDKGFKNRPKGLDNVTARKNYIADICRDRFPDVKINNYQADAVGILMAMEGL